jgi:hypothetical protein
MRDLPIGMTDLKEILKEDEDTKEKLYYYADKTEFLYKLVRRMKPHFLSRPRRFGKTLLVDSLEYLLRGEKEVFKGLWIDDAGYDWPTYPVIRLEMNGVVSKDWANIEIRLSNLLKELAAIEDVKLNKTLPADMFKMLIRRLYFKYNKTKVAILIDEYDAPILRHITNPFIADEIRQELRDFYGVLKTSGRMIGHIFITGVSRFTKASIFSELNNLTDITVDDEFATICGLTEADLVDLLGEYQDQTLAALIKNGTIPPRSTGKKLRKLIDDWYDGYSWDGITKVYNPWSVLSFFAKAKIEEYWYETGSPSFLIELGRSGQVPFDLSKELPIFSQSSNAIDSINLIDPAVLLFQTGYLTIDKKLPKLGIPFQYSLTFPNLEVRAALMPLGNLLKPSNNVYEASKLADKIKNSLFKLDAVKFEKAFENYLSQFTYDIHKKDESFYQAMFETAMFFAKVRYHSQEHTAHGRLDLHLTSPSGDEFIIEFKLYREDKPKNRPLVPPIGEEAIAKLRSQMAPLAKTALKQITERYQSKFGVGRGRVVKVALVIARRTFVLVKFEVVDAVLLEESDIN